MADIELAHGRLHIAAMRGLTDWLREEMAAGGPAYTQVDPDTSMNVHTWDAALRSAGAALAATDAVMAGELENAFCAVRPPGHHACATRPWAFASSTTWPSLPSTRWSATTCKRVAMVDFDVHHGNGTEDILAGDDRALMVGFFQHPFYPFSGDQAPAANMLNVPVAAYTAAWISVK